jgi:poly(A) polymerase
LTENNPLRTFATDVVRQLTDAGFVALWAGGCVRDLMLGRAPQDYDVATNARPEQVREVFGRRRTHAVGESFGVILVLESGRKGQQIEVATFRTEGVYSDGRRPDSVEFCTPEEDARRRDFTINGMFFDPLQEKVLDYVGGEADLGQGVIRAIGIPQDRMSEDKLRMLRAPRFTATLDFHLDEATAAAIRAMAGEIRVVSWERITQELQKMLVDQHRERAIRLCHDLGLLAMILPELTDILPQQGDPARRDSRVASAASRPPDPASRQWWHTLHMLGNLDEPSFELALAALLHTVPSPVEQPKRQPLHGTVRGICKRMRLSNYQTDQVSWLVAHQRDLDEAADLPLARLKRLLVHKHIDDLLTLARLSAMAEQREPAGIDFAADYLSRTPAEVLDPPELIDGADLQSLGMAPGPQFKEILTTVRDAQLNEEISTREEAIALAQQLAGGK